MHRHTRENIENLKNTCGHGCSSAKLQRYVSKGMSFSLDSKCAERAEAKQKGVEEMLACDLRGTCVQTWKIAENIAPATKSRESATPVTVLSHLTQRCQCASRNSKTLTGTKRCARHGKCNRVSKVHACHEKATKQMRDTKNLLS